MDSKAPVTVNCSSHWFDAKSGVAAVGWYEQGVRFLDYRSPGAISQVGYYIPANGSTWAAYWSPTDPTGEVVYTADAYRGVDVLRIDRRRPDRQEGEGAGPQRVAGRPGRRRRLVPAAPGRRLRVPRAEARRGHAVYHSVAPAWGDANLRELAAHVETPLFLAHIRAAIGSPVQQTNCHPFRHGRWLFVHNGFIAGFHDLRRDLMLEIEPSLFADVHGSTDSEVIFRLALTYGLEDDPIGALERAVGFIESTARARGVADVMQASFGFSDGERLWGVRYSTAGKSRTLFRSADAATLKQLHPDNPRLERVRDDDYVMVSEPFSDLPGVWHEIPEATVITLDGDGVDQAAFRPAARTTATRRRLPHQAVGS